MPRRPPPPSLLPPPRRGRPPALLAPPPAPPLSAFPLSFSPSLPPRVVRRVLQCSANPRCLSSRSRLRVVPSSPAAAPAAHLSGGSLAGGAGSSPPRISPGAYRLSRQATRLNEILAKSCSIPVHESK